MWFPDKWKLQKKDEWMDVNRWNFQKNTIEWISNRGIYSKALYGIVDIMKGELENGKQNGFMWVASWFYVGCYTKGFKHAVFRKHLHFAKK